LHEGGLRVPLIARLKGRIGAGTKSAVATYFPDVLPTIAEALKLKHPGPSDGSSLWSTMNGQDPVAQRRPMVWVFPEYGGQVAVRIGDFKVMRTGLLRKQSSNWMVFNLASDPYEQTDQALEKPALIEAAIRILRSEHSQNGVFPMVIPGVNE
jgi:arylsulfatase A-like enzyme